MSLVEPAFEKFQLVSFTIYGPTIVGQSQVLQYDSSITPSLFSSKLIVHPYTQFSTGMANSQSGPMKVVTSGAGRRGCVRDSIFIRDSYTEDTAIVYLEFQGTSTKSQFTKFHSDTYVNTVGDEGQLFQLHKMRRARNIAGFLTARNPLLSKPQVQIFRTSFITSRGVSRI